MRRTDVGDERVARRAADALADRSMKRAATSQDTDEAGEDGLGEFREAIAEGREQLLDSQSKCDTGYVRGRHGTEIQPPHA
jgi:hypothetical protein